MSRENEKERVRYYGTKRNKTRDLQSDEILN